MAKKRDNIEDAIEALTITMRKQAKKTVKEMANLVKKEVEETVSKKDMHTPKWLKSHGHPYRERNLHNKAPFVHRVSDNLWENIEIFEGDRKDELQVGVDSSKVPYVEAVLFGVSKGRSMIARDFLAYSILKVQKKLRKMVTKNFKKDRKSKLIKKDLESARKLKKR